MSVSFLRCVRPAFSVFNLAPISSVIQELSNKLIPTTSGPGRNSIYFVYCFFIGHRDASAEVLPALTEANEVHIAQYGVTEFIVGGYGRFDCYAGQAVIQAKQHPGVTLSLLLPYHPAERPPTVQAASAASAGQ